MSYILRLYPDVIKAAIGRIVKDERIKSNAKRVSERRTKVQELEKILEEIKDELKDIYLDIANNYNISDLQYDGDKVACVASKFRCDAGRRIEKIILNRMNDGWIPAEKELPEEHTCIDEETGYYGRSDDVLCSAYDDYTGEYETWIDYTMDGQWQTHEWYEGEPLAWQPLPRPYSPERSDNHDGE